MVKLSIVFYFNTRVFKTGYFQSNLFKASWTENLSRCFLRNALFSHWRNRSQKCRMMIRRLILAFTKITFLTPSRKRCDIIYTKQLSFILMVIKFFFFSLEIERHLFSFLFVTHLSHKCENRNQ